MQHGILVIFVRRCERCEMLEWIDDVSGLAHNALVLCVLDERIFPSVDWGGKPFGDMYHPEAASKAGQPIAGAYKFVLWRIVV